MTFESMGRDYDKLFEAGTQAQREKLLANNHKDGFDSISIGYAIGRLEEEFDELEKAYSTKGHTIEEVRHEAADVANFAHMIILKCDKLMGKKE